MRQFDDRHPPHERPFYQSPCRPLVVVFLLISLGLALLIFIAMILQVPVAQWPVFCLALWIDIAATGALTFVYARSLSRASTDGPTELRIRQQRGRVVLWLAVFALIGGAGEFASLLSAPVMDQSDLPMAAMMVLMLAHLASAVCLIMVLGEPLRKELPPPPPPPPLPRHVYLSPRRDPNETGLEDAEMSGNWDEAAHGRKKKRKKKK